MEAGNDVGRITTLDTKQEEGKSSSKPATMSEWLLRFGLMGNLALQAVNVLRASTGESWGSLTTAGQVGRAFVYVSSGLGVVHTPVVVYKQRQLTKEETFRQALNGIRLEQSRLAEENDALTDEIDDLQDEVDRMKEVETALRELTATQGTQLGELMDLIKKNKEINEGMRTVLQSKCIEEVVSLVLDMDVDGSFNISAKEIDRLIIGMKLIEGISFDSELFRQEVIKCDGLVEEVIPLIKSMIISSGCGKKSDGKETKCKIEVVDSEQFLRSRRSTLSFPLNP